MKTLKISNGEVRIGYEITDLCEDAQSKAMREHEEFLLTLGDGSEEYTTNELIENLEANEYLFNEAGVMLPLRYNTVDHTITYQIAGKSYNVEFVEDKPTQLQLKNLQLLQIAVGQHIGEALNVKFNKSTGRTMLQCGYGTKTVQGLGAVILRVVEEETARISEYSK